MALDAERRSRSSSRSQDRPGRRFSSRVQFTHPTGQSLRPGSTPASRPRRSGRPMASCPAPRRPRTRPRFPAASVPTRPPAGTGLAISFSSATATEPPGTSRSGSGTARSSSARRAATAPTSARSTGTSPRPAGSAGASAVAEQTTGARDRRRAPPAANVVARYGADDPVGRMIQRSRNELLDRS